MAAGDIARSLPPPGKLGKAKGSAEPYGGAEETTPAEGDDEGDHAAQVSQMQEFMDALKGGDAEEACTALDAYLDSRKPGE